MLEWLEFCSHGHVGRAVASNMEAATLNLNIGYSVFVIGCSFLG